VPVRPESDLPTNELNIKKSELDIHLDESDVAEIQPATEMPKKKKVEVNVQAENEVFPKDEPYTQGGSTAKIFTILQVGCLTFIAFRIL